MHYITAESRSHLLTKAGPRKPQGAQGPKQQKSRHSSTFFGHASHTGSRREFDNVPVMDCTSRTCVRVKQVLCFGICCRGRWGDGWERLIHGGAFEEPMGLVYELRKNERRTLKQLLVVHPVKTARIQSLNPFLSFRNGRNKCAPR